MLKLSIIIICFNEENTIFELIYCVKQTKFNNYNKENNNDFYSKIAKLD